MVTGLKSHIDGCTGTGFTGIGYGIDLGMGSAGPTMIPLAHHNTIPDNNGANTGIGRSPALPFFCQPNGKLHIFDVIALHSNQRNQSQGY